MYKNVSEYLEALKKELKNCDPALVQDALSDAEGHLRFALEEALAAAPNHVEAEAITPIIEKYGNPQEIASAYQAIESHTSPTLAITEKPDTRSSWARFFGVLGEARAWGAFFYMLLTFITGLIFGGWAILAGIFSTASLLLVIGIGIVGLFLLSIRGIALLEGRIVEALLGIRMPRRPLFLDKNLYWKDKFMALIKDPYTWKSLLYSILLFPLGLIYSMSIVLLFTISISFVFSPIMELALHLPLELFGTDTFTPVWILPFVCIVGFFLLHITFHYAKLVGKFHGRFAKAMLVRN